MAQNSKVTKWAKDNQEALYMLYEDGVLSEEQLRTLVNLKGDYDVTKQDAEFDKIKQTIQSKLTDERINAAVKNNLMSDNDAKIYGSLFKSVSAFFDGIILPVKLYFLIRFSDISPIYCNPTGVDSVNKNNSWQNRKYMVIWYAYYI